jgi:hypothetical protein
MSTGPPSLSLGAVRVIMNIMSEKSVFDASSQSSERRAGHAPHPGGRHLRHRAGMAGYARMYPARAYPADSGGDPAS